MAILAIQAIFGQSQKQPLRGKTASFFTRAVQTEETETFDSEPNDGEGQAGELDSGVATGQFE